MKFLVDLTVVKLGRWLRILGYDTLILTKRMRKTDIADIAKKQERIILTRDKTLHRLSQTQSLLIKSPTIEDQLNQVVKWFYLTGENLFTRCPKCNSLTERAKKEDVKGKVEDFVWERYDDFYVCKGCKQIYWMGEHFETMKRRIEKLPFIK